MKRIALLLLLTACAKKEAANSDTCGELRVTVDGVALPAMPHGLAKANNMNGDISYEVDVFDHDKTTCDMMLDKAGREIPLGEVSVRAFAAGDGMTGKGVAISSHTQMGGDVTLASLPPKAVGDVVRVCVNNVAFKPIVGEYKDKQVVVNGLFVGTYCGEVKW